MSDPTQAIFGFAKEHLKYTSYATHQFPEHIPYGWGTAFIHYDTKWNNVPGQVSVSEISTQETFWNAEVLRCEVMLTIAIESKDGKRMEIAFDQLLTAKARNQTL